MHMHRGNRPAVRVRVRTYVYACTRREGNGERVASVCPASVEQGRIEGRIGSLEEGKREREKADRGCERDSFQSVSLELSGRVSRARREGPEVGPELGGGGGGEGR